MALLGFLAILMGTLLGYTIMVRQGQLMGAADPNWWLHNHRVWIRMSALGGGFVGMLTSPVVAACLWRKNLLTALPLLYGMSAAVLLFNSIWLPLFLPFALAVILIIGGSLAIRAVLPDAIRAFRPGFCPACGHDLQGIGSERCPECGATVRINRSHTGTLKGSVYYYPVRKPWVLGLAGTASIVLLFIAVSTYHNQTVARLVPITFAVAPTSSFAWPNAKGFLGHWNSGMNRLSGAIGWGPGKSCDANMVFFPADDHRDRVIEVFIPAKGAPPEAPAMQIQLGYLYQTSRGSLGPYPGDPFIVCSLNAAQARYIWNNDIPTALLDAIIAAADNADWEPLDPHKPVATEGLVVVDPRPFFP